ncbi:MAG: PhnA-like protein, partial [Alphaproteobacteria bacterium]
MINEIAWGAVAAGVAVTLVVQALLNMLGIGIGAATIEPASADNPSLQGFSLTAAIWWVATGILAAFAGGCVAGRLSGRPKRSTGSWHGLITWAVTTLLIFFMVASAIGGLIGGAFSAVGSAMGGVGAAAGGVAEMAAPAMARTSDPFARIERQVRAATGGNDPAALRDAAVAAVRGALTGDPAAQEKAREAAAEALARARAGTGEPLTIEQAREEVARYEQEYRAAMEEAKRQLTEAADVTAKLISRAAIVAFVALLLGAVAGWVGGGIGTVAPMVGGRRFRTVPAE